MSIQLESLRKPPENMIQFPELKPTILGPISIKDVKLLIHDKIQGVADKIQNSIFFWPWSPYEDEELIKINDSKKGIIFEKGSSKEGYLTPREELQAYTLEAMQQFGVNINDYKIGDLIPSSDGTIFEDRYYHSNTIKGLVFRRICIFDKETSEPISVDWDMLDRRKSGVSWKAFKKSIFS
jgi:hypothetical protein